MAKFRLTRWLIEFLKKELFEFEWDDGNREKNFNKHKITAIEAEEAFYAETIIPLGVQYQPEVSEERFALLSTTFEGKGVFLCFTLRGNRVRVINIRPMNKQERFYYEKNS